MNEGIVKEQNEKKVFVSKIDSLQNLKPKIIVKYYEKNKKIDNAFSNDVVVEKVDDVVGDISITRIDHPNTHIGIGTIVSCICIKCDVVIKNQIVFVVDLRVGVRGSCNSIG